MMTHKAEFDVIVVGGSYAGMAAALQLARARRRVLVLDAGQRRNRFAATSHGFLTQDGASPAAIAERAREQLLAYPTVQWRTTTAHDARQQDSRFLVTTDDQATVSGSLLVLAPGVIDEMPTLPGIAERWGKSVFHCPYCHGYELNQGRIGVLATGAHSLHQAQMLPDWGSVTLFTNGTFAPDDAQRADLQARGVVIETAAVTRIIDTATVVLSDGRQLPQDGLFTACRTRPASPLGEQLGCAMEAGPLGPFIQVDALKATSVPGVFACGDAARGAGNVALSVGDGTQAGVSAHRTLLFS